MVTALIEGVVSGERLSQCVGNVSRFFHPWQKYEYNLAKETFEVSVFI